MRKNFFLFIIIFLFGKSFGANNISNINYEPKDVAFMPNLVTYKILNPLQITIIPEIPYKMSVKSGIQKFLYTEAIPANVSKPMQVKIRAPYNFLSHDDYLDSIYGTATIELENGGNFTLNEINGSEMIRGRGYLMTNINGGDEGGVLEKKLIPGAPVSGGGPGIGSYSPGEIWINAIFNEDGKLMKKGTYKGVLKLNVTYGGSGI